MNSTLKAIVHGIVSIVLFAIPLALSSNNAALTLTVGGVLNAIYHYFVGVSTATA